MPGEQPYLPRPGVGEQTIVEEMLRNREAEHWKKCNEFVTRQVHFNANNLSRSSQEEIIQEVMCKIFIHLPEFRFGCALKSWLYPIIHRCIINEYRRLQQQKRLHVPLVETFTESDHEGEELKTIEAHSISVEESFEKKEKLNNWVAALLEYANTHANSVRNRQIIKIVLFEERTQAEAAKAVGCDAGVVNYVIREAQRYAREKMDQ